MTLILKEDNRTIGERIRQLRKEKGLTLEELGKRLGIQKTAILKYEKGTIENIPKKRLDALAYELGVTYEYLTTGYDRLSDVSITYDEFGNGSIDDSDKAKLTLLVSAMSEERAALFLKLAQLPPQKLDALATLAGIKD